MVGGKRVKEYFQIVYDYKKQTWVFNYAKGMTGFKTFAGYRLHGNKMVGEVFAEQLVLSDYSIQLNNDTAPIIVPEPPVVPEPPTHNPMGPSVDPTPSVPWAPKKWQTVYSANTYRVQELR